MTNTSDPAPPEVSVVVPAHNAAATIEDCLRSLLDQDFPRDRYEIIVVENGSTDDTADRVRQFPVRLIESSEKGQYRAVNLGIADAKGRFLALTDADCRPSRSWLTRLRAPFDDPTPAGSLPLGGCGGPIVAASQESAIERFSVLRRILDQEKMLQDETCSAPFLITANAMFRMAQVRDADGFDPHIVPGDADFSWRLRAAGFRLHYVPDAVVEHVHRASLRAFWEQVTRYGEGHAQLFKKHGKQIGRRAWIDPRPYIWALKALLRAPYAALTGRTRFDRLLPLLDFVSNTGLVWGKIRGSLRKRTLVF